MDNYELEKYSEKTFENIKHINEYSQEYWLARELSRVLQYSDFRNFENAIYKAMEACKNSENEITDHFGDTTEMVAIGSGAQRPFPSYMLSRYACYLIVMNSDPQKDIVALGQTYFAVKTRQQELVDDYERLTEEEKRIAIRAEMKNHNKSLAEAAQNAGVSSGLDFAIFQNCGYQGLYGGLNKQDIARRKGLGPKADILDHMGSTELAANLFRATQTDEKLRRENIKGRVKANRTHFEVGSKVRETIKELGGTMPENLPTPDKSVRQLEKEQKKKLKTE